MRRRRHVLQVSTFPFLAVLLCTMGSLILLLLVIDRRAKAVARYKVAQAAAESLLRNAPPEKVKEDEWAEARRRLHAALEEEIQQARSQAELIHERAGTAATSIAGEESQIRDLHKRLEGEKERYSQMLQSLTARKEELAKTGKEDEATEHLRRQLTADLTSLEQTLADLQALRKREQRTFSLVPYKGRRGDTRRPIYLECTATGWIFHPDLKTLSDSGDGLKTLRAEFEGRLSTAAGAKDSAPYVFLLVRPDGITNYYRAQAAMQGLHVDFGYEFVDASWILDFSEKPETRQPWMSASAATPGSASPLSASTLPKKPSGPSLPGPTAPAAATLGPAAPHDTNGGVPGGSGLSRPGNTGVPSDQQGSRGTGGAELGTSGPGVSVGANAVSPNAGGTLGPPEGMQGKGQLGSGSAFAGAPPQTGSTVGVRPRKGVNFSSPNGSAGSGSDFPSPITESGHGGASATTTSGNTGNRDSPFSPDGSGSSASNSPGGLGNGNGSSPGLPPLEAGNAPVARAPSGIGDNPSSLLAHQGNEAGSEGPNSGNSSGGAKDISHSSGSSGSQKGSNAGSEAPTSPLGPPAVAYPGGNSGGTTANAAAGQGSGPGASSGAATGDGTSKATAAGGSGNGESSQEASDDKEPGSGVEAPPLSRFPKTANPKTKNAATRPARLTGNRDWIIPLECTADAIVLPTGAKISAQALATGDSGAKSLLQGVQEVINRKQATVRAGEPEYRPQVRFLVHPDGLRLYHLAYPTLEPLQIPILRQNVEPDDPHQPAKGVRKP